MPAFSSNHIQSTTQDYLEILDIANNMLILKNGTISLVMTVGSLNFGLLSEEEQDAIIYSYAGLLNSLSFPIQIVIRSQQKDISAYLQYLQELEQETMVPIRKTQIRRYRGFIGELVKERNILDKKFYIIIPYIDPTLGVKSAIPSIKKKGGQQFDKPYLLEKAKTDLEPKRDHLIAQFARLGLFAKQLSTQELIHLMYNIYNPRSSEGQLVADTKSYTTAVVETSLRGLAMQPSLQREIPSTENDAIAQAAPLMTAATTATPAMTAPLIMTPTAPATQTTSLSPMASNMPTVIKPEPLTPASAAQPAQQQYQPQLQPQPQPQPQTQSQTLPQSLPNVFPQ